jgi:hypothetical protein
LPAVGSAVAGSPCSASSRKKKDAVPAKASLPDFVTTEMDDPADRPCSAENRLVEIWNSWTASRGRFASGPPTTSSLLSWPSMVMFPPRPSWPAEDTAKLFVLVGSKLGAGALPGTSRLSSRKFRPLSGRFSIAVAAITSSTADRPVAMGGAADTVSVSFPVAATSRSGRSRRRPTSVRTCS